MISTISLRMLKSWWTKKSRRSVKLLRPEAQDRLLDQVVEQLLDEGGVRLFAAGQVRRQAACAGERHRFARPGLVGAGGVDRLALLILAVPADGVEVLQGEAQGLIIPWHVWHDLGLVWSVTRSRVVRPGWRSGASGATASGGAGSARPSTPRERNTPRWIGELVAV